MALTCPLQESAEALTLGPLPCPFCISPFWSVLRRGRTGHFDCKHPFRTGHDSTWPCQCLKIASSQLVRGGALWGEGVASGALELSGNPLLAFSPISWAMPIRVGCYHWVPGQSFFAEVGRQGAPLPSGLTGTCKLNLLTK